MARHTESWSDAEIAVLCAMMRDECSFVEIGRALGRTADSVRGKAYKLGLKDDNIDHYCEDPTVQICLNCKKPKCTPNACKDIKSAKRQKYNTKNRVGGK